jgi:dihydrofolate reductase
MLTRAEGGMRQAKRARNRTLRDMSMLGRLARETTGILRTETHSSAIEQAKKVAGEKTVIVAGANVAQQALKAGLLDEIEVDLVPVLLVRGIRLFEYLGSSQSS